jgi:hypothetical protein
MLAEFHVFRTHVVNALATLLPESYGAMEDEHNPNSKFYIYLDTGDNTHPGDIGHDGRYVILKPTFMEETPYGIAFMQSVKDGEEAHGPVIAGAGYDISVAETIVDYLVNGICPAVAIPEGLQ